MMSRQSAARCLRRASALALILGAVSLTTPVRSAQAMEGFALTGFKTAVAEGGRARPRPGCLLPRP